VETRERKTAFLSHQALFAQDGLTLIALVEILSKKKLPKHNLHPRIPIAKIENLATLIKWLQEEEKIKLVNIGAEDIHGARAAPTLGLIWTLILHYQIGEDRDNDSKTSPKQELLDWVRSKIPEYNITGFKKDWNDGRALNALIDALGPGLAPGHKGLNPANAEKNTQSGIDLANDTWGVPKVIDGSDLANPKVDEQAVMTYISYFRDIDPSKRLKKQPGADAAKCSAYGPGLVESIQGQDAPFTVETPADTTDKLAIEVTGPDGAKLPAAGVKVTASAAGKYGVIYTPPKAGTYKIAVTLGGHHIPGSVFTVVAREDESIGGEGKILVFFSTTSSTNKGKSDNFNLQRLLEAKLVHKRADFLPWIPIDVLEKDDRDAIFRKAGTRSLPIVYVDDKYIGDFDTIQQLEEVGELNKLLNPQNWKQQ
jgi:glutaredoxin-related protein